MRLAASSAPTRPVPQRAIAAMPQFAIAARQEEEQSRLAIGPGNRIRPVGVADSSNTRVEVAAPRGAVMQHRTLVAGDGASAAAGILALPDAGPAAFAAVSLQMRAQRGQTPSAAEWRTMPQLRAEWWLCRHCRDAVNRNSATTCSRCGSSVREMTPYASPAEVAALSTNAQRTAYGRRLKSVQGKEQPVALAVAQTPGSAGYASAVLAQIARAFSLGRSGWRRWWSLVFAFLTDGSPSRLTGLSGFGRATMCGHSLRAARERLSSPSTFSRGEGVSTLALRGSH